MAVVEPPQARSRIEETVEGLTITIPTRRHWLMFLFILGWLVDLIARYEYDPPEDVLRELRGIYARGKQRLLARGNEGGNWGQ